MNIVAGLASVAVATALAGGAAWSGWSASRFVLGAGRSGTRLAGAAVATTAVVYLVTHALLTVGIFRPLPTVGVLAVLGAVSWAALRARGIRPGAEVEADAREVVRRLGGLGTAWGLAVAAAVLLAAVRVARALALPPLGWDALVYHLFKAGRWVALGAHHVEAAPGAWGFYEWFASAGDVPWAWAFLAARDGAWLAPAGGLVWASACLAAAFLARRLGASDEGAIAVAVVTGTMPAVAGAITASYVDTALLAMFLLGTGFLVGAGRGERTSPAEGAMAGVALGLAGAIKVSLLPAAPIAAAFLALRRSRWPACVALTAGAVPFLLVEYSRAWWEKGSPFWPFPLSVLGVSIAPGDDELARQLSGFYAQDVLARTPPFSFLEWLFLWKRFPGSDFAGFGPLSAVLLLLGFVALPWVVRRTGAGFVGALLAAAALVAGAMSPENVALRTVWVGVLGRHLAPAFVVLAAAGATLSGRWTRPLWLGAAVGGFLFSLPRGWGELDVAALAELILPMTAGLTVGAVLAWGAFRKTRSFAAAAAVSVIALAVPVQAVLADLRPAVRWAAWRSTVSSGAVYDLHFLDPAAMSAWSAWHRLDDGNAHTVAVTAGYAREGQSWYLYPLLGSALENRVRYVSAAAGAGEAVLDRDVWIGRLLEENVDFVMCLWPPAAECSLWVDGDEGVFPTESELDSAGWSLHRFDRDAAERLQGAR